MATLNIGTDLKNYIINLIKSTVRDVYYPVGKIYITIGSEDPNKTIGGTWSKISGGYLWGCNTGIDNDLMSTNEGVTKTFLGGSGTSGSTVLTAAQSGLPAHQHPVPYNSNNNAYACGYPYSWNSGLTSETGGKGWNGNAGTFHAGGWNASEGHNHTVPNHSHKIPHIGVWVWKRTK